jgi:hypothetical protein
MKGAAVIACWCGERATSYNLYVQNGSIFSDCHCNDCRLEHQSTDIACAESIAWSIYLPLLQPSAVTGELLVELEVMFHVIARLLCPSAADVALLRAAGAAAYSETAEAERNEKRVASIACGADGRCQRERGHGGHHMSRSLGDWPDEVIDQWGDVPAAAVQP